MKGFGSWLSLRVFTNIVIYITVVVTHAGNVLLHEDIWAEFYSNFHQTHCKSPCENLSLIGPGIWEKVVNMHTDIYIGGGGGGGVYGRQCPISEAL